MSKKLVGLTAALLLISMLGLAFFSLKGDSATMDELAHIPAGYSYITQKDMRLNPEHPPLLKDLSGFSVWLLSKATPIVFPGCAESWQTAVNGQWDFGRWFLYRSGNNADRIIFWARIPMLLILLILGLYVFKWARELYGDKAGLIALFLYSFSPTFIAHGRYVTTDVGAAAAFFIASYYLVKWLKTKKGLITAGIVFGLALLTKFSLVLLIPYFVFITIVWCFCAHENIFKKLALLLLIGLIGMALVWPVYQFHTWNYPAERQLQDTLHNLGSYGNRMLANPVIWMSDKPLLRPYGQFFHGLLMVIQRSVGGNTTYFLGEISNTGWPSYFPIVFLIKVPLVLLILSLIALFYALKKLSFRGIPSCIKNHFDEFALLIFFLLYWYISIRSTLNIGVRHVLPVFPILYVLISGRIKLKRIILFVLLAWYAFGTIKIYPSFLTYFNETVGVKNGYKYVVDSNLDWGQDLKRLKTWTEKNNVEEIYIDYFGGGDLNYYFGDQWQAWWSSRNPEELPDDSWLAVSATFLQGGRGKPAPYFNEKTDQYTWLNDYQPVTVIGNSIFVYHR